MVVGSGVSLSSGHNSIVVALGIIMCAYPIIIGNPVLQYVFSIVLLGVVAGLLMELFVLPHTVSIVGGTSVSMVLMMLMSDGAMFVVFMVFLICNSLVNSDGCIHSYLLCSYGLSLANSILLLVCGYLLAIHYLAVSTSMTLTCLSVGVALCGS